MANMDHSHLKALFNAALDLKGTDRARYLDAHCAGDAAMRARVEALLAAAEAQADDTRGPTADAPLLASGTRAVFGPAAPQPRAFSFDAPDSAGSTSTRIGQRLGPYKLLQKIGEGGFGTVYLAAQAEPVRRKVAVKVIKPGMDSKQVIGRFEAERQALALMDHPHIASVLDGGLTDDHLPYFVMEYVVGDAINVFADAHKLTLPERLALFEQVCSAVQHAHTKGIIHRDLKPGNILVSMVDGKPFAKVIDFGIAKATGAAGGRLTDKTFFTEHRQLIGTPEYMSPEQAEGSPDIDTRTDVYALGVLLYELLVGATPFDAKRLRSAAFAEMQRIIKEEEPPMPSLKVTRSLETLASTAARRRVEPGKLSGLIKGELDWIVMKALDKERSRRYDTPSQLAADVQRHLAGDAVIAAPPSAGYRVRKFVRRNKAATTIGVVMLVGVAGTTAGLLLAQHNARVAINNYKAATAARQQLTTVNELLVARTDDTEWSAYMANIVAAQADMSAGNWANARQRLAACPESKRGWEWRLLANQAASVRTQFEGDATLSIDGKSVATVGSDGAARVFDLDGTPLSSPIVGDKPFRFAVLSPMGTAIATATFNVVQVWDLSGRALGEPIRHNGLIDPPPQFHPDGTMIITWSEHDGARVYGIDGRPRSAPVPRELKVRTACFTPDGRRFVTAAADGSVQTWTLAGEPTGWRVKHDGYVRTMEFSPDGQLLLTASEDGTARLWDMSKAEPLATTRHGAGVTRAVFSPDASGIVTTAFDQTVRRWTLHGQPIGIPLRTGHYTHVLAVSKAGEMLATPFRSAVVVARAVDGTPRSSAMRHDGMVKTGRFTPDANFLLVGTSDSMSRLWDLGVAADVERPIESGELAEVAVQAEFALELGTSEVRGPQPAVPFALGADGRVVLREDAPAALRASLLARIDAKLRAIAITPDGTRLVTGGEDGAVRFWEMSGWRETAVFRSITRGIYLERLVTPAVKELRFTPDGTRLVVRRAGGSATVFDTRSAAAQKADLQRRWAERVPAGAYLDGLWARAEVATAGLREAVVADASLTPLRRLVAAELLEERLADLEAESQRAFEALTKDQTDPATVRQAAAAADLPWRVKEKVVAEAATWQYKPTEPTAEQKLAEENKQRRLTEATLTVERFQSWDTPNYPGDLGDLERAVAIRDELLGEAHSDSAKARWMLGIYRFAKGTDIEAERDGLALMRRALSEYQAASPLSDVTLGMQLSVAQAEFWVGNVAGAEAVLRGALAMIETDGRTETPKLELKFSTIDTGGSGFQPGFHGKRLLLATLSPHRYDQSLEANRARMAEELRRILEAGLVESTMYLGTWIGMVSGPEQEHLSASRECELLTRLIPNDARVYLPAALHRYREGRVAGALNAAQQSIQRCAATPPPANELRPNRCDPLLQQGVLALIRHRLTTADDATLAAAAAIDGKPGSLTNGKVLTREEHRAAAREALTKARALMAPAADGTASPWANDEDAKALLAEATVLIEGPSPPDQAGDAPPKAPTPATTPPAAEPKP